MKVIFLDIDGVMNCNDYITRVPREESRKANVLSDKFDTFGSVFTPKAVKVLNEVIKETNAKIVISSTWRRLYNINDLQELLFLNGINCEVIDKTIVKYDAIRGHEIQDYLDKHPEVESFVIIDDDDDMKHLSKYLVKTSNKMGLREIHRNKIIKILNKV